MRAFRGARADALAYTCAILQASDTGTYSGQQMCGPILIRFCRHRVFFHMPKPPVLLFTAGDWYTLKFCLFFLFCKSAKSLLRRGAGSLQAQAPSRRGGPKIGIFSVFASFSKHSRRCAPAVWADAACLCFLCCSGGRPLAAPDAKGRVSSPGPEAARRAMPPAWARRERWCTGCAQRPPCTSRGPWGSPRRERPPYGYRRRPAPRNPVLPKSRSAFQFLPR